MNKIILLYICMLLPLLGKAQILKDSTVNTVAYWHLGEKYKYVYTTNEYSVEGTDTIWGDTSDEIFMLEVVDSTATGYVLKYQTLESKHNMQDKDAQNMLIPLMEKYKHVPLYFATNEYGTFQDLAYWDKTQAIVDTMINEVKGVIREYWIQQGAAEGLTEEEMKQLDASIENIYEAFRSKEMTLAGASYLTDLLYYHGTLMSQNREYTGTEKHTSPWNPGEQIDVELSAKIHKVNYDSSWVTYHRTQRYDAGQLLEGFMRQMQQNLSPEQMATITPDQIPFIMTETFLDLDVHTGTGWPGDAYYKKVTQIGTHQKVSTWYIELQFDE